MSASIFEPVGDLYLPTEAALGPWSDQFLHGGPPAMLLARELERTPADQPMFVTRMTVELLRPVSRAPLSVRSRVVRPGRRVQLVEASLWDGETEVARATGLRMRQAAIDVPHSDDPPPHGPPESVGEWASVYRSGPAYHVLGVEIRGPVHSDRTLGPGWAWFRLKLPVVPGEVPSGLLRICAAADFPNGISNVVDPKVISFVNPDVSLYVNRLPRDEWVMVEAKTWLEPHGTGLAEGALYDRVGRIGRCVQSLFVEPR